MTRIILAALLVVDTSNWISSAYANSEKLTAQRVRSIFERRCARCHANGKKEGGFGVILNRNALVEQGIVVPISPFRSLLYQLISNGQMPKNGPPLSSSEKGIIELWINDGAMDWNSSPSRQPRDEIQPEKVLALIANDLDTLEKTNARSLQFTRYLTLTHLYNAGSTEQEMQRFRSAVNRLVNSLSWSAKIVNPQPIDPARTILRIDLRDYQWTSATWERILEANPYGIVYKTAENLDIYSRAKTNMPHVRADWFVAKASVPPLYHDILNLPRTSRELERRLRIDTAANLVAANAVRAGFSKSGIAVNNRILERHQLDLSRGSYWRSYDFDDLRVQSGNKSARNFPDRNVFSSPLGPSETMPDVRRPFRHAAGELIWTLPNGLHGYMIIDRLGDRIDTAPIAIVSDTNRRDRIVVNGQSCMGCHVRGLIDKTDQVRETVLANRSAYSTDEIEQILALYPEPTTFKRLMDQDREAFARAVTKTGRPLENSNPVVELAQRFDADVSLNSVAAEIGLTPQQFVTKLDESPQLARELGQLRVPNGAINRGLFVGLFGRLIGAFGLGTPISANDSQKLASTLSRSLKAQAVRESSVTGKFSETDLREIEQSQFITARGRQILQEHGRGSAIRLQGRTLPNGAFQSR